MINTEDTFFDKYLPQKVSGGWDEVCRSRDEFSFLLQKKSTSTYQRASLSPTELLEICESHQILLCVLSLLSYGYGIVVNYVAFKGVSCFLISIESFWVDNEIYILRSPHLLLLA